MITIVCDVAYDDAAGTARSAAVVLAEPTAAAAVQTYAHDGVVTAAYRAGALYARELPALRPVLERAASDHAARLVIVDAHVEFSTGPGLGRRVADAFPGIAVIGIAKNPHPDAMAIEVRRGGSDRPLWVGAVGMSPADAAAQVSAMAGPHRIPTAVRLADQLARGLVAAAITV